jgi:NAD(P)-dependent dehydrogenase (short-subunit alcohol dehydrogenase family)
MFFSKIDEDEWDKMAAMNFKSMYNCCYHAHFPMMEKKYGRIINTSSLVGKSGGIGAGAHYCATKAGPSLFQGAGQPARPLEHHGEHGSPGMIETEMILWRTLTQMRRARKADPPSNHGQNRRVAGRWPFWPPPSRGISRATAWISTADSIWITKQSCGIFLQYTKYIDALDDFVTLS